MMKKQFIRCGIEPNFGSSWKRVAFRGIQTGWHTSRRCLRQNGIIIFMSLFTSNRERRLWLWTLVVLVAILLDPRLGGDAGWGVARQGLDRRLLLAWPGPDRGGYRDAGAENKTGCR